MRDRDYFALAALNPSHRRNGNVLEDYVRELAQLYDMPGETIRPRFERFLDVYYRGTAKGTEEEWAAIRTGDLEHSFIRISKPYRFRSAEMVPEALRVIKRSLQTSAAPPSLLEFGGGFGNDAIVYARQGFEVHYADLVGLRNTDVVARRFALRGLEIQVHDVGALPDRRFDVITAMDVLEHVYDVEEVTAQLAARIPLGGILCCVNAFGAITYDGDHHDKNRVYLEVFDDLMAAAGFEIVPAHPPLSAYRRRRQPAAPAEEEVGNLRPVLYEATKRKARERCGQLLAAVAQARPPAWERLPLDSALASIQTTPAESSGRAKLRARAYAFAAPHAPRALKRARWRRERERTTAALQDTSDPAQALGALADWTAALRIAEHRLHGLGASGAGLST